MSENPRKSFRFLFIVLIICFIGIVVFGWMFLSVIYAPLKEDLGKRAVMDMYNFDTVTQLSDQDSDLKSITNDDGYNALSVTRSDNSLNKYLKFNKKPVSVNVINSVFNNAGGYVQYSLTTPSISSNRVFLFTYSLTKGSNHSFTITNPQEFECINFKGTDSLQIDNYDYDGPER